MRKIYTVVMLAFFTITINATNSDLFSYDVKALNKEFEELNELEEYVNINESISLANIEAFNSSVLENLNLNTESPFSPNFSISEMDWGAFAWGLCCNCCGVYIVTLQKDRRTEERLLSAISGMAISTLIFIITYTVQLSAFLSEFYY